MLRGKPLLAALFALLLLGVAGAAVVGAAGSQAAPGEPVKPALKAPAAVPGPAVLPEAVTTIQRTFASTSGDDTNPCTRALPCRNFAAAIAATTAGGEVVALDSGGYGPFTVPKAITIAGAPGAHVAVTGFSGNAVHINAGAGDMVVLRNLYLTGLGAIYGIFFQTGGMLKVESVVAAGFDFGLYATAAGELFVTDSRFRRNVWDGVLVSAGGRVEIADSRADLNGRNGFFFFTAAARGSIERSAATRNVGSGFEFWAGAAFSLSDSLADGNGATGVDVEDPGTSVVVSGSVLSNNALAGLRTSFNATAARIGGSTVFENGVGLQNVSGTLLTFGDNLVHGNTTQTAGTITPVGKT